MFMTYNPAINTHIDFYLTGSFLNSINTSFFFFNHRPTWAIDNNSSTAQLKVKMSAC